MHVVLKITNINQFEEERKQPNKSVRHISCTSINYCCSWSIRTNRQT